MLSKKRSLILILSTSSILLFLGCNSNTTSGSLSSEVSGLSSSSIGFDGSVNIPTPPSSAINKTEIQNLASWASSTGAASSCPNGVTSSTCNPPNANYNSTVVQTSDPATLSVGSGISGLFELDASPAYATVVWGHSLFTSTTARSFIWDFYVYVNGTDYQASELDFYAIGNGQRFMMGSECNRAANTWDTWNENNQNWVHNPSIQCNAILTENAWHHVTFYSTIDTTSNTYTYHVIRVDGVDYVLNQAQPAKSTTWPEGLIGVQVQLDANSSGSGVNEYLENTQVFSW